VRILDEQRQGIAERERSLLQRLVGFLEGFGGPPEDIELAGRALADLEEMFMLVIVGEFNSGKSAFINALLGSEVTEEGVTPTTDRITVLRYGEFRTERGRRASVLEKFYPNEFLREVSIVDTPGTNAIIREHEELSRGFVPRSDLVLFITSADRPLSESERGYLELIRDWGKKILIIVNKVDLLRDEESAAKIRTFVQDGIRSMLDLTPPIFFVSALLAAKAKAASSDIERKALLSASGFDKLEEYIFGLLDEEGRVRLKLESPLGMVEELSRRYRGTVDDRMELLAEDFKTSENVESQLTLFVEDMRRDFEARLSEIDNIILKMSERGDTWFEDNVRLGNFRELMQRDKVQRRFEEEVVGDTESLINEKVDSLIDWLVDRNLKQWRSVVEYVNRRRQTEHDERMIGAVGDNFEYNRSRILNSVGKNATEVVRNYDREAEAKNLSFAIQSAVAQTAATGIGAVGVGTVVVVLASTRFLDATGIIAAGIIAGFGLFILPNRRRKARDEFREKTENLRAKLSEAVSRQFDSELNGSVERMREAIAPYTRFVRTEHTRMTEARDTLAELAAESDELRAEISAPKLDS
jgi:small GTP-binding protein